MCVIYFVHIFCDKHIRHCLRFNSRTVNHAEDNKLYIYLSCIFLIIIKNTTTGTEQDGSRSPDVRNHQKIFNVNCSTATSPSMMQIPHPTYLQHLFNRVRLQRISEHRKSTKMVSYTSVLMAATRKRNQTQSDKRHSEDEIKKILSFLHIRSRNPLMTH